MPRPPRPVLLVWLLLASLSTGLLLRAWLAAPKGTTFVGTFFYVDDFFNYLSMAEQAQRGELLFRSKLASPALPPALVNLEWLVVGWLAALLGGRTVLAFRLFGMLMLGAWVFGADRFLVRSGMPGNRRIPALLLVFTGGGLGGLLWSAGRIRGERAFDLFTGAFPFVETLANPHFVTGSALLLGALTAFAAGRTWWGAALGVALSLVRPYDAALLIAIEGASTLLLASGADKLRRLLPLAAVLPGLAYMRWLVAASRGYGSFGSPLYSQTVPTPLELAIALGPAVLLASTALVAWRRGAAEPAHLTRLALWALAALLVVTLRPVPYSLQFIVGLGLPLLALAAIGLAHLGRSALFVAVPLMATSSLIVAWLCTIPGPRTHPPLQSWLVARALRPQCRPGDLVLAPAQIGLYVGGLTPCWPFVSHAAAPDYAARLQDVARFYDPRSTPSERAALLAAKGASYVVLPPALPPDTLGAGQAYVREQTVSGPLGSLEIWGRREVAGAVTPLPSP